jgi:hypothetical protein
MRTSLKPSRRRSLVIPPVLALICVALGFILWQQFDSSRFLALPMLGGLIAYYWFWHLHDIYGQRTWLFLILLFPGVLAAMYSLSLAFNGLVAKPVGRAFAPDFRAVETTVIDESCVEIADRLTKCNGFTTRTEWDFYSSSPGWETLLNSGLLELAAGVICLVLLLLALLIVTLFMSIRSRPEMSEDADWIIQAQHIYDDAKPVVVELEDCITQRYLEELFSATLLAKRTLPQMVETIRGIRGPSSAEARKAHFGLSNGISDYISLANHGARFFEKELGWPPYPRFFEEGSAEKARHRREEEFGEVEPVFPTSSRAFLKSLDSARVQWRLFEDYLRKQGI